MKKLRLIKPWRLQTLRQGAYNEFGMSAYLYAASVIAAHGPADGPFTCKAKKQATCMSAGDPAAVLRFSDVRSEG